MKGHSGGSHNAQAVPDAMMGHQQYEGTLGSRKTDKKIARKKRRQHTRKVIEEEG